MTRSLFVAIVTLTLSMNAIAAPDDANDGLLILAYGIKMKSHSTGKMVEIRSEEVVVMAEDLNQTIPTEAAFSLNESEPIQEAVNRLEKRGIKHAFVVPVFVTSHSAIIGNFKYMLGLQDHISETSKRSELNRVKSNIEFTFLSAMDTDPIISQILLDKALESSKTPENTTLILIAHGPENQKDNEKWMRDMKVHADYLTNSGKFSKVLYTTLRSNSPEIDQAKVKELRDMIQTADAQGDAVLIPTALTTHGLAGTIKQQLEGLNYTFGGSMMPHDNIKKWVVQSYQKANVSFTKTE